MTLLRRPTIAPELLDALVNAATDPHLASVDEAIARLGTQLHDREGVLALEEQIHHRTELRIQAAISVGFTLGLARGAALGAGQGLAEQVAGLALHAELPSEQVLQAVLAGISPWRDIRST